MKLSVAAAALALAIGTAASAFAAPPASTTTPAAPATHAAAPMIAKSSELKANGTIKTVSDTGFTLTTGKAFKLDAAVKSSSLKAGEKVKVQYKMKNHERWATEVTPS
ncbi:MAG: hypothetical protein ABMA14_20600 [Hyphomonadaceae bacterium]